MKSNNQKSNSISINYHNDIKNAIMIWTRDFELKFKSNLNSKPKTMFFFANIVHFSMPRCCKTIVLKITTKNACIRCNCRLIRAIHKTGNYKWRYCILKNEHSHYGMR